MATEVGKGFVEVTPDFKNFGSTVSKEMSAQQGAFAKFGTMAGAQFKSAITAAAIAAPAAIAAGVVLGVKASITAATDLNEQLSKTNAVFGTSAGVIVKWADTAATSFGQSKTQALEAASSFGNMFLQLGIGADEATKMSMKMTELASDFASFFNTNPAQALDAISAAFRGEFDAVQRFVPTINAAAVEHKALEMGLKATTKELTATDKAMAAYQLILEGAGKAAGDFDRTSDSLANRQRILSAQITDLSAAVGNALLPTVSAVAGAMIQLIGFAEQATSVVGGLGNVIKNLPITGQIIAFASIFEKGASNVDKLGGAIGTAVPILGNFVKGLDGTKQSADETATAVEGTTAAAEAMAAPFSNMATVGMSAAESQRRLNESFGDFEGRAAGLGDAMDEYATATAAADQATKDLTASVLGLVGGEHEIRAAQQEVIEATERANEVNADATTTTLEKSIADDRAVESSLKLAQANYDQVAATGDADGAQLAFISTLEYLANSASPAVRAQLEGVIGKLKETGEQHPEPTATLDDQASGPIRTLQERIAGLDGTSASIVVHAEAANARAALDGIIERANRINGMRIVAGVGAGLAEGIRNFRGGIALVGEEGPEIVHIPRGSDVYTNAESKALMSSRAAIFAAGGIAPRSGVVIVNQGTFLGTEEAFGKLADRAIAQARRAGHRVAA